MCISQVCLEKLLKKYHFFNFFKNLKNYLKKIINSYRMGKSAIWDIFFEFRDFSVIFFEPSGELQHPSINKRAMGCLFPCTLLQKKRNKNNSFCLCQLKSRQKKSLLFFCSRQKHSIVKIIRLSKKWFTVDANSRR